MAEMPKLIRVERERVVRDPDGPNQQALPGVCRLLIDGIEFPWHMERRSIVVEIDPDGVPSVQLRLIADRVEVVDEL